MDFLRIIRQQNRARHNLHHNLEVQKQEKRALHISQA